MPLSRYESSHQELLLSLVCVFLLLFLNLGGQNKIHCLLIFESSLCFCVVICENNLDGKQHLSLFFSEKVILFVSILQKLTATVFRGCVNWDAWARESSFLDGNSTCGWGWLRRTYPEF